MAGTKERIGQNESLLQDLLSFSAQREVHRQRSSDSRLQRLCPHAQGGSQGRISSDGSQQPIQGYGSAFRPGKILREALFEPAEIEEDRERT